MVHDPGPRASGALRDEGEGDRDGEMSERHSEVGEIEDVKEAPEGPVDEPCPGAEHQLLPRENDASPPQLLPSDVEEGETTGQNQEDVPATTEPESQVDPL